MILLQVTPYCRPPVLESADALLDFGSTIAPEGYEWPQKCKVAWGGGEMLLACVRHRPAGRARLAQLYPATRRTVVGTFLVSQGPDGGWGGEHYRCATTPRTSTTTTSSCAASRTPPRTDGVKDVVWAAPEELTGEFLARDGDLGRGIRVLANTWKRNPAPTSHEKRPCPLPSRRSPADLDDDRRTIPRRRRRASLPSRFTLAILSGVISSGRKKPCGLEAREPLGMPRRYLSVNNPCASGENAMQPMPSCASVFSRPSSIQRLNML